MTRATHCRRINITRTSERRDEAVSDVTFKNMTIYRLGNWTVIGPWTLIAARGASEYLYRVA